MISERFANWAIAILMAISVASIVLFLVFPARDEWVVLAEMITIKVLSLALGFFWGVVYMLARARRKCGADGTPVDNGFLCYFSKKRIELMQTRLYPKQIQLPEPVESV